MAITSQPHYTEAIGAEVLEVKERKNFFFKIFIMHTKFF
jgi:hypothetical protein